MKNIYNNQIKIKTHHLLRIYSNTNQNINRGMNIQREHFHFYKPENLNLNKKSKLMSSNGQKIYPFHGLHKNHDINKIIYNNYDNKPIKTDYNLLKDISNIDLNEKKKYRKISKEQINKFKNSIDKLFKNKEKKKNDTFSTTVTKDETLNKNLKRSKSTLLKSISRRETQTRENRRTISNKSDVLQILDETIKGLKRLRTIILDDEDEYKEDEPFESFGKKLKISKKKSKLKLQLENGLENMNELIRSSITGDIIKKNTIYSKYNSLKNRSITPNESMMKTQKNKYIIDMEKHKNKKTHYKNNSFLIGNKNNKIKNHDTEVHLGNFNLQRNNSQLMENILKVGKTYYQMQKNAKKQNKKVIRYNNESGTDTLANFEFSD